MSAPKGASPGPGGCTCEHLRVLLDEVGILDLPSEAVSSLAQATVPQEVAEALTCGRMTALAKPEGGVRGITRLFFEKTCGKNVGQTVRTGLREGVRTIPVCVVYKSWD